MDTVKKFIGRHWSDEYMEKFLQAKLDLGCHKYYQKRYDEAERLFQSAVKECERFYGVDHDNTSRSKYWLGKIIFGMSRYNEAEKLFRQAVQVQERLLGPGHNVTINYKFWLGLIFFRQGKYDKAEKLFRQAVQAQESSLGPGHEDTVDSKYWLGVTTLELDSYDEAEKLLRQVVQVGERSLGPNHKYTLLAKHWLGCALFGQGKHSEAENLLRQVVQIRERSLGPNHEFILWGKYWLGRALTGQGKHSEAEKIFRWIMHRKGIKDRDYERMHEAKYQLARVFFEQKKYVEAEDLLRQNARISGIPYGLGDNEVQEFQRSLDRQIEAMRLPQKGFDDTVQRMGWMNALNDDNEETSKSLDLPRELHRDVRPLSPTEATTEQALAGRLDGYFAFWQQDPRPYTDSTIREIQVLLRQLNIKWSRVPRTYIILRITGHLNLLDKLIDAGFSDYWFPVTEKGLPDYMQTSARAKFVRAQNIVLTKSLDLERGQNGQHCYFAQGELLPFDYQGRLGSGGFGQVDKIISHTSFKEYALKRVRRNLAFGGRQKSAVMQFIREIEILKRLRHDHIVKFVASYTDSKYIGLLMSPVAEMNLKEYLGRIAPSNYPELRTFYGCLATALKYLHEQKKRHKDIKPSNILVNQGNILFTDFGLSLDFEDTDCSTTTGMTNGRTPRYCAPEVAEYEGRNTKSDIWSLGVVFMEMTVVLKGKTIQDMDEFFEGHGSELKCVRTNPTAFKEFTTELEGIGESTDNRALHWAAQMLVVEQRERPTASELVTSITSPGEEGEASQFCGICCVFAEEDEFSD